MAANPAVVRLFKAEWTLCHVTPDATVAILSEGDQQWHSADVLLAAAQNWRRREGSAK